MTVTKFWVFVCLVLFEKLLLTEEAVLTVSPVSVTTVPSIPPYTSHDFTCEGTGNELNWLIGGVSLSDTIKQERDISVTPNSIGTNLSSILTVTASPINDGLSIGCQIISYPPFQQVLSSATLTIRGVSPVEDLMLNSTSNGSLLITWSPPTFYSNDIPFGSTPQYKVILTNYTGDVIFNDTVSTTSTVVNNVTRCDNISVSVIASSGGYNSLNNTSETEGSYTISLNQQSQNNVSSMVTCTPTLCRGTVYIDAFNNADYTNKSTVYTYNVTGSNDTRDYNYTITGLDLYKHYILIGRILDLSGNERDKDTINISTYNVKDIIVTPHTNGSVSVQCILVEGSTADGCHVIFTNSDEQRNFEIKINITATEESAVIYPSVSGNYNVSAYDIVNGTTFGPAESTHVEVTIPSSSPLPSVSSTDIIIPSSIGTVIIEVSSTLLSIDSTPLPTEDGSPIDKQEISTLTIAVPVSIIVFGLLVLIIAITIAMCWIKASKKKSKTLRQDNARVRNPLADVPIYGESPTLRITLGVTPLSPSDPVPENPYFDARIEFLQNVQPSPFLDDSGVNNVEASLTSITSAGGYSITSQESEYDETDRLVKTPPLPVKTPPPIGVHPSVNPQPSGNPIYAQLSTINKETAPIVPPTTMEPSHYTGIKGHCNEGNEPPTMYNGPSEATPTTEDHPPKYENIDTFKMAVPTSEDGSHCSSQFIPPSVPQSSNEYQNTPIVHSGYNTVIQIDTAEGYEMTTNLSSNENTEQSIVNPDLPELIREPNVNATFKRNYSNHEIELQNPELPGIKGFYPDIVADTMNGCIAPVTNNALEDEEKCVEAIEETTQQNRATEIVSDQILVLTDDNIDVNHHDVNLKYEEKNGRRIHQLIADVFNRCVAIEETTPQNIRETEMVSNQVLESADYNIDLNYDDVNLEYEEKNGRRIHLIADVFNRCVQFVIQL